jgi:hypothetical protein
MDSYRTRSAKQHARKTCLPHQQDIIPYVVKKKSQSCAPEDGQKLAPKHVELILKINKTVIVASSCCSIFTLPTLMMHGQTQIKATLLHILITKNRNNYLGGSIVNQHINSL